MMTRIEGNAAAQVTSTYGATAAQVRGTNAGRNGGGDRKKNDNIAVSDVGREVFSLVSKLKELPDVREDRVSALKKMVADGSFSANAASVAERLLQNGGL